MSISIQEFQVAMETYGAIRLDDRAGPRRSDSVPCFRVGGVSFLHSGSYYIVQRDGKVPDDVFNEAMAAFGEKHPGGANFWWGETHTIKGILTLVSMLEGKYDSESVDELTNAACKKLLECPLIQSDVSMPFFELPAPNLSELRKVLKEYDGVANPFGNDAIKLKDPIAYLDQVGVGITFGDNFAKLSLTAKSSGTKFFNNSGGLSYQTNGWNDAKKAEKSGYTSMVHYYDNGSDRNRNLVDEVIALTHTTGDGCAKRPGDIDLSINMVTGLAWRTYREEEAAPATDEQVATMIFHLRKSIARTKRAIISKMVKE